MLGILETKKKFLDLPFSARTLATVSSMLELKENVLNSRVSNDKLCILWAFSRHEAHKSISYNYCEGFKRFQFTVHPQVSCSALIRIHYHYQFVAYLSDLCLRWTINTLVFEGSSFCSLIDTIDFVSEIYQIIHWSEQIKLR